MSVSRLLCHLRRLRDDERGNIALMMGLLAVPVIGAAGLGVDYTRSSAYRSQLDSAAAAASVSAVDTVRALLAADPNMPQADVIAAAKDRVEKVFQARAPQTADVSGLVTTATVNRVGETISADVRYTANIKTTFGAVVGVDAIALEGAAKSNGAFGQTPQPNEDPNLLINENFQAVLPGGANWALFPSHNNWQASGGGVEIGRYQYYTGVQPPTGATMIAELDGDANVALSKKVYMPTGDYELRYWVKDRVGYINYNPVWICGSKASDVDWANDTVVSGGVAGGYQSNRVGVYLDNALSDTPPAAFSPATNSLIDVCATTGWKWIERSVKITVNQPGFYWLTFQGEGASNGRGALLSGIRLCRSVCAGQPVPAFAWTPSTLLFRDSFETPAGVSSAPWFERTLDASGSNSGWTRLAAGWTTSPFNQVDFVDWAQTVGGAGYGAYAVELDGSGGSTTLRAISRRFLFTPGYYQIQYRYLGFPDWGSGTPLCGLTDMSGQLATAATYTQGSSLPADTAILGVYLDPDLNVSHPEVAEGVFNVAQWKDPDGGAETKPRLPRQKIDACTYSKTFVERTVNVRIFKPGAYWLTFRADGRRDAHGGGIDLVGLTALGDPTIPPPANVVNIAYPGAAPGSPIVLRGVQVAAQ